MTSYLLFMLLLVEVFVLNVTAQEHDQIVAKDGCRSQCGDVTIPFPFGIGKEHCYLDYMFEISCYNNTPELRRVGHLEVLEISIKNHTMRVSHPVFSACGDNEIMNETADLRGTPFFFSPEENMFTGLGCRSMFYMTYLHPILLESQYLGGCFSVCDIKQSGTTRRYGLDTCSGKKCCQTGILSSFQLFNMTTTYNDDFYKEYNEEGTTLQDCRHAFLVEQNWFLDHQDKVPNMTKVPVVLDWRVCGYSVSDMSMYKDGFAYYCNTSSFYQNYSYCRCSDGYGGNPYLKDGCSDIDECKNKSICDHPSRNCVNTIGSYYCSDRKLKVTLIILGIGISLVCLFLLFGARWLNVTIKRRKEIKCKDNYFKRNGGLLLQQQLSSSSSDMIDRCKLFNSKDLDKATDNFNIDRILGQGGQGTVYKGMLADGCIIAVKKSKVVDEGKLHEFINEVVILSQINHRNVVKLLGCCLETEVPLLVYEFVSNGTLFQYLHSQNEEILLTWDIRLRIATEIAESLSYMHSAASRPIYHRDIKSMNILLDDKLRAKVADFGTSKSVAIDQTHVTTKVQGTFGYMDPEFYRSSQYTDKSDVYSFGVVLVELLTGKKPISSTRAEEDISLVQYFLHFMEESRLYEILDPQVRSENEEEIMAISTLAKKCLNMKGKKRPSMKEVSMKLEGTRASSKEGNLMQNYQEVECVKSNEIESWDIISSSTSTSNSIIGSITDDQPLTTY